MEKIFDTIKNKIQNLNLSQEEKDDLVLIFSFLPEDELKKVDAWVENDMNIINTILEDYKKQKQAIANSKA